MKKILFTLASLSSLSAFAHTDFICYRDQYDMRDRKNPILAVNTNFSGEITSLQFRSDDNQVYTFTGRFNTSGDEVGTIQISDQSGNFIAINQTLDGYKDGYIGHSSIYFTYANGREIELQDVECVKKTVWNMFAKP